MGRWIRSHPGASILVLAFTLLLWREPLLGGDKQSSSAFRELLLTVEVNGQVTGQASLLLQGDDEKVWASEDDLTDWRLRRRPGARYEHLGRTYVPLSGFDGISYRLDSSLAMLRIAAAPRAFEQALYDAAVSPPLLRDRPQAGGFLNYHLHANLSSDGARPAGLFELGLFNGTAVLVNEALFQHDRGANRVLRLGTTLYRDQPDRMSTLEIGDAVTRPGAWGRSLRFGGLRYGTKFATQPGFTSFPLQLAKGEAALPSVVDVYVKNALVLRRQVPPGPFTIASVPMVTGDGDMQLVVTDLLGRQQVTSQSFYASSQLLREGLEDHSYELGFARRNYGITGNDYGSPLASATYRKGLSNTLTAEWRGEAQPGLRAAGATVDALLYRAGVLTAGAAVSNSGGRTGTLALLGFQRQAGTFSFGVRTEWHSREFRRLGLDADAPQLQRLALANANYRMKRWGSISLAYAKQEFANSGPSSALSATYTLGLGKLGSLSISATRAFGEARGDFIVAGVSIPLSPDMGMSVSHAVDHGFGGRSTTTTATLQRSLPAGPGYGYRVLAREDGSGQAALSVQSRQGTYTLEAAQDANATAARLDVSGGAGWIGGRMFLSREITDSFAVVRVPEHPAIRVQQDNQVVATTDAEGYAVLPRLRAYESNRIGVEQGDLPLDSIIDRLTLETVPSYRSGVYVEFPIRRSRSATLRLLLDDGTPVPAGASARLEGNPTVFPVAQDGQTFLSDLKDTNRLVVSWKDRHCELELTPGVRTDPLPDLGAFVCREMKS